MFDVRVASPNCSESECQITVLTNCREGIDQLHWVVAEFFAVGLLGSFGGVGLFGEQLFHPVYMDHLFVVFLTLLLIVRECADFFVSEWGFGDVRRVEHGVVVELQEEAVA